MAGKVPPRPQSSKAARKVKVRPHERNLKPWEPKQAPKRSIAERFRGGR